MNEQVDQVYGVLVPVGPDGIGDGALEVAACFATGRPGSCATATWGRSPAPSCTTLGAPSSCCRAPGPATSHERAGRVSNHWAMRSPETSAV